MEAFVKSLGELRRALPDPPEKAGRMATFRDLLKVYCGLWYQFYSSKRRRLSLRRSAPSAAEGLPGQARGALESWLRHLLTA